MSEVWPEIGQTVWVADENEFYRYVGGPRPWQRVERFVIADIILRTLPGRPTLLADAWDQLDRARGEADLLRRNLSELSKQLDRRRRGAARWDAIWKTKVRRLQSEIKVREAIIREQEQILEWARRVLGWAEAGLLDQQTANNVFLLAPEVVKQWLHPGLVGE